MKITHISVIALACCAAPLVLRAGVDIGVNIGGPEVVVQSQPPPERNEVIPMNPGPGYVWIRGHWNWHHEHWEWMNGHWDRVSRPGSVWIAGQWVPRGHGWVWVEGHYDVQVAPPPMPQGPEVEVVTEAPPAPWLKPFPRRRDRNTSGSAATGTGTAGGSGYAEAISATRITIPGHFGRPDTGTGAVETGSGTRATGADRLPGRPTAMG